MNKPIKPIKPKNVLETEEKRVQCPICEGFNCLEEQYEEIQTWLCTDCGYHSNSSYKNFSKELKSVLSTSPQLVVDLKKFDDERSIWWFPTIINMPLKGILYPDGTVDEWQWLYTPIVDIPESERQNYPIPGKDGEFFEKRLAEEKARRFKKDDFFSALKAMGAILDKKG